MRPGRRRGRARPGRRVPRVRVLVLTADIGAGHDLPAELLADGIRDRRPRRRGRRRGRARRDGPVPPRHRAQRGGDDPRADAGPVRARSTGCSTVFAPTRRLASALLVLVGARGLLKLVRRLRPDVIVSTYPGSTEIIGALRRAGRIRVPCVSAITDLAALRYWAHPGIDLHLVIHAESRAEVARDRRAARRRPARPRPVAAGVRAPARPRRGPRGARPAGDGQLVLVSGGGWGLGDVEGAARTRPPPRRGRRLPVRDATPACGRGWARAFAGDPLVRVEGFTDAMCAYLAAADVLVHSTAGLTMLEAQMCGTRAISYGWGVAHIRANNRAYQRFGLAAVAGTPALLEVEMRRGARRAARARPVLRRPPPRRRRGPRARRRPGRRPEMRAAARPRDGHRGRLGGAGAGAARARRRGRAARARPAARCRGAVALTFDDGPHPQGTPAVLEVARRGGRARDVLPRRRAGRARDPALAAEIAAAGHAVALHGDRHRNLLRLPPARRSRDDLDRARGGDRRRDRRRARPAPRAVRHLLAGPRCAPSARAAGRRCCGRAGAATGRARATPAAIARDGRAATLARRRRPAAPRRRRLQRARQLARAPSAALPRVLDAIAAAGLRRCVAARLSPRAGSTAARTSGSRRPSRCSGRSSAWPMMRWHGWS